MIEIINECRLCNSKNLSKVLSLGDMSLTGVFVKAYDPDPVRVPLDLMFCDDCHFVQLKHSVDPDKLYESYWYRSGTNKTMTDHLHEIANEASELADLKDGDICIDTGCNDGTLLSGYFQGVIKIGIDPSDAIKSVTDQSVIKINKYFSKEAVISALGGKKASIITSISMFYDVNKPSKFIKDIADILSDNGVWIVEMNYTGFMIARLGYDMISHEHVGYYTIETFKNIVEKNGLYVNNISFNEINSGSVRFFISKKKLCSENVLIAIKKEHENNLHKIDGYHNYYLNIERFKVNLNSFLKEIRSKGSKIGLYGASTRGNTILQHCNITKNIIFAAADRNPDKWGLETSGSRIPIISEKEMRDINPEYLLIAPYYFLDEFIEREKDYLNKGGKFIVPLPILRVISSVNGKICIKEVSV